MAELLPCPFCGALPKLEYGNGAQKYWYTCENEKMPLSAYNLCAQKQRCCYKSVEHAHTKRKRWGEVKTLKEYPENIIRELWIGHKPTNINKNDFGGIEKRLEEKLFTLTDRERYAINLRFKEKMTFEQVGENLQNFHEKASAVCKERARQIVNKALRKLKHPSRSGYILLDKNDANFGEIKEYISSLIYD